MSDSAASNASLLVRDYSPTKGSDDAKVTIVEFFDPACETCKAFHPFIGNLMAAHPGKIKVVMRNAAFHHGSDYVVAMLEAARLRQDMADAQALGVTKTPGFLSTASRWSRSVTSS